MKIEWDTANDKVPDKDELRAEYKRSDFSGGLLRGKYAKRIDSRHYLLADVGYKIDK